MTTILGIDLGKFKSVFCFFVPGTGEVEFLTCDTDPATFRDVLRRRPLEMVLFETCTAAGWVADLCDELGLPCRVANPLGEAWQWKRVQRETDRDDALKLVRMHLMGELPTVHVPAPADRQRRSLIGFRRRLVKRRTAIRNHIRSLFQAQGLRLVSGPGAWTAEGLAAVAAQARPIAECAPEALWRGELHAELALLAGLEGQIAAIESQLDHLGREEPGVALLRTIPGVGPRTAEAVVAYLGDARRFRNSREVSSYAGLVPRQFQSGTMDRRGGITKRGPSGLRTLLVECAWMARRHNPWAARLVERISGGLKARRRIAIVALARKLLVVCWAMPRTNQPWREPGVVPAAA